MAITIKNKLGPSSYTPSSECNIVLDADGNVTSRTPKPGATSFVLRPLSDLELMDVVTDMKISEQRMVFTGRAARTILTHGVVSCFNLKDENGKDIHWSPLVYDMLPRPLIEDLAWEIFVRSTTTEAEIKN